MARTHFSGPVVSANGFEGNLVGNVTYSSQDLNLYYEDAVDFVPTSKGFVRLHALTRDGVKEQWNYGYPGQVAGDYLAFYTPGDVDYVNLWYSVDGMGSPPGLGGTEVEVALITADINTPTVWTKTKAALDSLAIGLTVTTTNFAVIFTMGTAGYTNTDPGSSVPAPPTLIREGAVIGPYGDPNAPQQAGQLAARSLSDGLAAGQRVVVQVVEGKINGYSAIASFIWTGSAWVAI